MSRQYYKNLYEQQRALVIKMRDMLYDKKETIEELELEKNQLIIKAKELELENEKLLSNSSIKFNTEHNDSLKKLGVSGIEREYFSGAFKDK